MKKEERIVKHIATSLITLLEQRDEAILAERRSREWGNRPHGRPETGRPLPRMEFEHVTEGNWSSSMCLYWLVIPIKAGDIRRDSPDGTEFSEWYVPMGRTLNNGRHPDRPPVHDGVPETPYRDGAHARLDRKSLGIPDLPIWAVCGEFASEVKHQPQTTP